MADYIIRIKDKNNVLIQEIVTQVPFLDTAPQGTTLNLECRERGYTVQYAGNYFTKSTRQTVPLPPPPVPTCPTGHHWDIGQGKCVPDVIIPPPVGGTLLFDARTVHPQLFSGVVKEYEDIGLYPNGNGLECRASGDPIMRSNEDGTFSLLCNEGHGRIYGYTPNYNARIEIEGAWWNKVAGQDCSIKLRSMHNEPDPCSKRFGGYGWSFDLGGFDSKREPCHNNHDQTKNGSVSPLETKKFWLATYQVKDVPQGVEQIATLNGNQIMNRITARQMADKSEFDKISYYWIRQNIDSGRGELRIKNIRVYAI